MAHGPAVRDRKKQAKWRRVVAGQAGSGLSVRAYCLRHGVKEPAFYWWRAELARRDAAAAQAAFVPVRLVEEAGSAEGGRIEIVLPGDRRVQVVGRVDRQTLADVVAVLEGGEGGRVC
jgi:transposase